MANVPLSGTNIRLMSGIPFNNDYKNTRWFANKTLQHSYFANKPIVYADTERNFQKVEDESILRVDKSVDELWNANYIMFQNAEYNNKWFYGFITKLEYKQKKTTYVHFEIDVFQTWFLDSQFKPSFVVREHRPLWNSDGTPVINTLDEELDYGTEYDIVKIQNWLPLDDVYFLVIVMKSAVHSPNMDGSEPYENQPLATNNGIQQPLTHYFLPFKMVDDNKQPIVSVNGSAYIGVTKPLELMQRLSEMTTTADNIVSMYVTDYTGLVADYNKDDNSIAFDSRVEWAVIKDDAYEITALCVKDALNYATKTENLGKVYNGYRDVKESKLLMYPYTTLTLTDFKGNIAEFKNEYIESKDIEITVKGSMGTSNKTAYSIDNYQTGSLTDFGKHLASMEYSLINNDPNDIPVITDMLSAYLQGNRNSIVNQIDTALWNGSIGAIGSAIGAGASAANKNPTGVATGITNAVSGAGNAVLNIQGIHAKTMDINNVPPQLQKMGSNTSFDYGNHYRGVYLLKKQIKPEYIKVLSDFFNMFGYKTNEVKVPNFATRKSWNYVQTLNCVITGDVNNDDLQELKEVFDNGITLWHTDDIGNYVLDNEVR